MVLALLSGCEPAIPEEELGHIVFDIPIATESDDHAAEKPQEPGSEVGQPAAKVSEDGN